MRFMLRAMQRWKGLPGGAPEFSSLTGGAGAGGSVRGGVESPGRDVGPGDA